MITYSNTIKLITLVWLANTFPVGYCRTENFDLNCTFGPHNNAQGIESRNYSVVNKCPKGYANKDIIRRCEDLINQELPYDTELYKPVINNVTNVAYWNTYCATCNNDNSTIYQRYLGWESYRKRKFDTCDKLSQRIQRSEVNDIYNLTQIFISEGARLVAWRYGNTQWECSTNGKWPFQLILRVIPCLQEDLHSGIATRLQKCQYAEQTGRICTKMKLFMDGYPFFFSNNKEIYYNDTISEYNFAPGQYYKETEYPGVYYVCDLPGTIYEGKHWVKISFVVISLIFIIINLGVNSNKPYFQQNNTNKLLYLYMAGLVPICIILLLIYLSHPVPCVAFYLAKFFWAYHFFWSMLIFLEFCLMAFGALHNRFSYIRYWIYFIFGFVIPFAMPIIYYFGVLMVNDNYKEDFSQLPTYSPYGFEYTCPIIPDHFGVFCPASKNFGSKFYENVLKIFLSPSFYFFIPALFSLSVITALCFFSSYSSTDAQSIPYKDPLMVVTKMTLIMGIHWILFVFYQKYGDNHSSGILGISLDTLCQLSIDLHGVIVFLVFGAKACVDFIMKMFGCEYKGVSQQDRNDDVEIRS